MKAIIISYNEAIDEEVMELLKANEVPNYTKWVKVLGKGSSSGPHLQTPVWPKANNVVLAITEDDRVGPVLDALRNLRKELGHEGIKAFVLPVESVT
jgi:nitrogen regulatory protein PII